MLKARDHTIDVGGLALHFLEWGERSGEPLVLIHGFLDHARSWEPLVEALHEKISEPLWVIAPDCRGHGDSGWVGAGGYYHFPDYVRDLHAILEHLEIPRIKLVGHSMGGTISFLYTGTFPNHVAKLMLIEGIGPIGAQFADAPDRMKQWLSDLDGLKHKKLREYSTLEDAAKALQRNNPRLGRKSAVRWASGGMKSTRNGTWIWKFDPLHRTTAPQPFYSGQAIEFFRRIHCPVLLVQGNESRHTPRPDMRQRLEAIAERRTVGIEAAGHMVHQDNPEALAGAIRDFFFR